MTHKPTSRRRKFAVAVAAITALTASVVSGITPFGPAAEAAASTYSIAGGHSSSHIVCSTSSIADSTMRLSINASVQTGFLGGQWIAYRYYLHNGHQGSWSKWTWKFVSSNNYEQASLLHYTFRHLPHGTHWNVYTQISWWNGQSASVPQGQWAYRGQAGFYFVDWARNICAT